MASAPEEPTQTSEPAVSAHAAAPATESENNRKLRKRVIGIVASDRMNKTRRVEITRLTSHPKYGKFIRRRTVCMAHDEHNESRIGDTVEIMESRPISKLKRWWVVRIVAKAQLPDTSRKHSSDVIDAMATE